MTLSHKDRFLASTTDVSAHRKIVDDPAFDRGADAAMLHYQSTLLSQQRDSQTAAVTGLKLQGAREFLNCFRTLADRPPLPRKTISDNLPTNP